MNELLMDDFVRLKQGTGGLRLSLFLPLSPGTSRSTKTRIRMKNLLARAERALRSDGLPGDEVSRFVSNVRQALEGARPLGYRHLGLAVFANAGTVRQYHVPLRLPELAVIGDRFAVTPLLPMAGRQGPFYLLALTQHDIRLFEGTPLGLEQVDVDGLELAAWMTMPPLRLPQVHSFLADRGGQGTRAVFHGVERESDERKARVLQHFRGAERALREVLRNDQAPLILAGARNLQALYRAVNSYPHLLAGGIDGSPEVMSSEELHRQAWPLAELELQCSCSVAIQRYRELRGTGRTVDTAEQARSAAVDGQVDTLLVNEAACSWSPAGNGGTVIRLGSPPAPAEHVELAVLATWRRAGTAFLVPEAEMPEQSSMAAILRY